MATRPTSDRLRETLFNVLAPRIEGARFVDLYAGSGAVGIEALSRGAAFCWFAENAQLALAALRGNLAALKIPAGFALEDRGVVRLLAGMERSGHRADIVFLDPPYTDAAAYEATLTALAGERRSILADGALVIAEHARKQPPGGQLKAGYGALVRTRLLEQGDAALSFYAVAREADAVKD